METFNIAILPACFGNYVTTLLVLLLDPTNKSISMPADLQTHISRSSQGSRPHGTPRSYDYNDDRGPRDKHVDRERSTSIGYSSSGRRRYHDDRESYARRDEHERSTSIEYTNKRSRHEHSSRSSRTPGTFLSLASFFTLYPLY